MRYSRSFSFFASSVSQKPFLVASSVASWTSLSINFWMSSLTFKKGSAEALTAKEAKAAEPSLAPSLRSKSKARVLRTSRSCVSKPAAARKLFTRCTVTRRPCRKEGAAWALPLVPLAAICARVTLAHDKQDEEHHDD